VKTPALLGTVAGVVTLSALITTVLASSRDDAPDGPPTPPATRSPGERESHHGTATQRQVAPVSWKRVVLEKVSGREGGFTSLNLNRDNAGVSVGIIQWAQAPGQLGVLLNAQHRAAPELFIQHFGGPVCARELRDVTNASTQAARMKPVCGHSLWKEPWISRFRAAQAEPRFQDVQAELATSGEHWQAAVYASELWGWATVRSFTVLYDRAVQQGAGFVKSHAKKVHDQLGPDATPNQVLQRFATTAYAHFRRSATPDGTAKPDGSYTRSSRTVWRRVDGEWHVFAGSFDLYVRIKRRVAKHLTDSSIPDLQIPLRADHV
jgi:hypothetical protein